MNRPSPTNPWRAVMLVLGCLLIAALAGPGPASAQTIVLSQAPGQVDAHLSDAKLQSLAMLPNPTGACVAENFVLASGQVIAQVRIWGLYVPGSAAPASDHFTVVIHADAAGLPGTTLSTQNNVPATRQATGNAVGGLAEYVYTLVPNPVAVAPGTYWMEICNDTTGSTASFYWEFGTADPVHGIPGAAFEFTAIAGSTWEAIDIDADRRDLAIEITAQAVAEAVPALPAGGVAIVSLLVGVSGVVLRRRRRAA